MTLGRPWSDGVLFGPHAGALVVDPSPLVREALAGRLRGLGARDVEEAASLEEARVRAHVSGPRALCVLEADLPEAGPDAGSRGGDHGRGLELLPTLRTEGWPVTVVLTSVSDPAVVRSAFLAGVQGYVLKTSPLATLTEGLRAACARRNGAGCRTPRWGSTGLGISCTLVGTMRPPSVDSTTAPSILDSSRSRVGA